MLCHGTKAIQVCNESMLKKKADQHTQRCYGAYFSCIDCSTTFNGADYRQHTSCITEDEKYQKALYRPKKKQQPQQKKEEPTVEAPKKEQPKKEKKGDKPSKVAKPSLVEHKGKDLYKALKNMSKDEKKELLKRITITSDGSLALN